MVAANRAHRILPVSVAVIRELQGGEASEADAVQAALEECVAGLRAAVPELAIDWSSVSLSGRFVSGSAPADQIERLHREGLGVGALVNPVAEYDVGLDSA